MTSPPPPQGEEPQLDPATVADDQRFGAAIGEVADHDVEYRTASRKIVRLQERLRERVGKDAWSVYLALETAVNDRNADFDERLVRWAFSEGRKHPAPGPDPSPADLPSDQR